MTGSVPSYSSQLTIATVKTWRRIDLERQVHVTATSILLDISEIESATTNAHASFINLALNNLLQDQLPSFGVPQIK